MNLLHLEDNEYDAELVEMSIRQEWPACAITRLTTEPEFVRAVERSKFDLILSDYSMPGFNGLAALEIARGTCPETPFIFLSGTLGEDRAIEALKNGATDYLIKGATARLIPAIRSALRGGEQEAAKKCVQEQLRRSQQQFQQIADSIHDFIVLLDGRECSQYFNPAFQRLLGDAPARLGDCILVHVHAQDRDRLQGFLRKVRETSAPREIEFRVLRHDGAERHLEARASVIHEDDKTTLLLAGHDVTDRRLADERLHEQASLLGKARDAICVLGLDFTISYWNASAERIYGVACEQALGRNARDLLYSLHPARFDTAFALTLALGEWHGESPLRRSDGREVIVKSTWSLVNDTEGRPKSILCIDADVTSRKQLERELQRSQRIESIGMLAGGIAHDLNNMLSPILMSIGILRPLAKEPQDVAVLDTVEHSATHGAELVQQILLFARGGGGHRTPLDLRELLQQASGILKSILRKEIALEVEADDDLWAIEADATQLKQVIMNLCVNARDAMPRGGQVQIEARNRTVPAGVVRGFDGEIPAGSYVRLSVADTGAGIPPEVLEKIFDPFFTTKELGKGTGLGLSTIMGIVQSHGGSIQVESVPNVGTTFHIYLPATEAGAMAPTPSVPTAPGRGHGESILVIDDDDGIRYVLEKILLANGYDVCVAVNGEQGLELFLRQRDRFRVVICDQMMPGLSGETVLGRIHREAPGVKLIAMSGLAQRHFRSDFAGGAEVTFLAKPLQTETLLRTVEEIIGEVGAKT